MPPTTIYSFGDVLLVPFPFTDQRGIKKRPAVVVSSAAYNTSRPDLRLMAITGQARGATNTGETEVVEWQKAKLLKASVIKPVMTTIEKNLVLKKLGQLEASDCASLQSSLRLILG